MRASRHPAAHLPKTAGGHFEHSQLAGIARHLSDAVRYGHGARAWNCCVVCSASCINGKKLKHACSVLLHTANTNRTWPSHSHAFCRDSTVDHALFATQKAGCFCCNLFACVALKTLCYFVHQLHWFHSGKLTNTLRELCDKMLKIVPWLLWPP